METDNLENIFFILDDNSEKTDTDFNMQNLLDELNMNISNNKIYQKTTFNSTTFNSKFTEYNVNELMKICEYYGLIRYIKLAKYKKNEIIHAILLFESDENNIDIVEKRYKMWSYMDELCKDKLMKKYIIWK